MRSRVPLLLILISCIFSIACGGGGGAASTPTNTTPAPLTITTASPLPSTLEGHAYSATLNATGGVGPLHWSISRLTPTASFVDGLSIDANTGVLSGTANFGGTAGFLAQVTDSSSPALSTTRAFLVPAYRPLSAGPNQAMGARQYQSFFSSLNGILGGVAPLSYALSGGSMPAGFRVDPATGVITGSPITTGTYQASIRVQDSFSPPEIVTQAVTITVLPATLTVGNSLPSKMALNKLFSGAVVAAGGTPPYKFAMSFGSLPPGLNPIDPAMGTITGTPSVSGTFNFGVRATDSGSPVQTAEVFLTVSVAPSTGRNDSPATATRIGNGFFTASISPYIDPPNGAPVAGDNDYYKLVATPGATVHVETFAKRNNSGNMLDTVIEIVDANGQRLSICRQPGDTSSNFTSSCANDDISSTPHVQDSALDLQVPAGATPPFTFVVHVLDWRGSARPDMVYNLQVNGATEPLIVSTTSLPNSTRGVAYDRQLTSSGGVTPVSWSISAGALPTGLNLSSAGQLSGTATVDGAYTFTVQGLDTAGQTATAPFTIVVGEPIKIISAAVFPTACVNQPYSFTMQTSGGVQPALWSFFSNLWIAINLNQTTGTFSGTTNVTGTFVGNLSVFDSAGSGDTQQVTLKVVQCP